MAVITWLGLQPKTRKVMPWTCNAAAGTYNLTHNLKVISFTYVSGTAADVVAELVAAWQASAEPEWQELEVSANGNDVVVTGPDTGAPFTVTASVTGSATMTAGTVINPTSPNDIGDNANYSGTLANSDTLVIPAGSADMLWNLEDKASLTGLTVIREPGGPVIGLPDWRATNYREYRPTRLKLKATTLKLSTTAQDAAGSVRVFVNAVASAMIINGDGQGGNAALGQEVVEIVGANSTSSLYVNGSSVAVATATGTTATIPTIEAENSTVNLGSGCTLTAVELNGCTAAVAANWGGSLVTDADTTLTVTGTATGTTPQFNSGTVNWNGTGNIDTAILGPGVVLDLTGGAGAVAVTTQISKSEGAVINDPGSRLAVPYDVVCDRSPVEGLNLGRHRRVTVNVV